MIRGMGIDATEVARFEKNLQKEGFCARVFTAAERGYIQKKGVAGVQSAAACFAAKEAALKAFGTGIGPLSLLDIWVEHEASGKPYLGFSKKAEAWMADMGAGRAHLSITHAGGAGHRRGPAGGRLTGNPLIHSFEQVYAFRP